MRAVENIIMARPKRVNPLVPLVRAYIRKHAPELSGARLRLRQLDGPAGAPRYAASVETCAIESCPYKVEEAVAQEGKCPIHDCALRRSLRLLLDRKGNVIEAHDTNTHWG
jgi:hypothetical protein